MLAMTDGSCNHNWDEEGEEFELFQEFEEAEDIMVAVSQYN